MTAEHLQRREVSHLLQHTWKIRPPHQALRPVGVVDAFVEGERILVRERLVGSMSLLAVYLLVLLAIVYMALRCCSQFARLVSAGVGITMFVYVFINVAMVMGLVPVVGVPLPLVSYGGTSMITLMFGFGLVLNAHRGFRTHQPDSQPDP